MNPTAAEGVWEGGEAEAKTTSPSYSSQRASGGRTLDFKLKLRKTKIS